MSPRRPSRMMALALALGLLSAMCLLTSGCFRPPTQVTERTFVVIHPGKPVQILDGAKKITGRTIEGEQQVGENLDLSGWVAMPETHWQVVKKVLDDFAAKRQAEAAKEKLLDPAEKKPGGM